MVFNTYQLRSPHALRVGAYVKVNGPHDTYGQVVSSTPIPTTTQWLNVIRGIGNSTTYNIEHIFPKF